MTSLRFTEEMKGYVTFGDPSCEHGYEQGRASDTELMVRLTIELRDVGRLETNPVIAADTRGHVGCEALGGRCPVQRGAFSLFAASPGGGGRRMLYRIHFADGTGHPLTLAGVKRLEPGTVARLWPETTTLYTRLLQGHVDAGGEPDGDLVASGILRIGWVGFLRQLTTLRAGGASGREQVDTVWRFGRVFTGELARLYGRGPA